MKNDLFIPILVFAAIGFALYLVNLEPEDLGLIFDLSAPAKASPAVRRTVSEDDAKAAPPTLASALKKVRKDQAALEAGLADLPAGKARKAAQFRMAEHYLQECDLLNAQYRAAKGDDSTRAPLPGKIRVRAAAGLKHIKDASTGAKAREIGMVAALLSLHRLDGVVQFHAQAPAIRASLEADLKRVKPKDRDGLQTALGRFYVVTPSLAGGDLPKAIAILKPVRETEEGAFWMGRAYLAMGRPEQALIHLRKSLKRNRRNPMTAAWVRVAEAQQKRSRLERARALLLRGEREFDLPAVKRAQDAFALELARAKARNAGPRKDKKMPVSKKELARLHSLIAWSKLAQCDILKFRRKYLDWADDDAKEKMLDRLDLLLEEGVDASDRAIALDEKVSDFHRVRGELISHRIRGMKSGIFQGPKAKSAIRRALELAPANPRARVAISKMYFNNPPMFGGDVDRAIKELKKAYRTDRSSATLAFLGRCYLKKDRYVRAIPYFKKALTLNPRNLEAEIFLAKSEVAKAEQEEKEKGDDS